jgi:lipopolysaccharide export LptBFGC system permease protein LptF
VLAITWFSFSRRLNVWSRGLDRGVRAIAGLWPSQKKLQVRNIFVDLTTGLRDFDIVRNLLSNFLLSLCFLTIIFLVFTAFELWKFAGGMEGGIKLLGQYLLFLLPYVYLQLAPPSAMIATLATYVIKSRQNEIVTWTSAGQSIYRLFLPCFLLMILIGAANWGLQEYVLPEANRLQDQTRTVIRAQGKAPAGSEAIVWSANERRIYSYRRVASNTSESDNEGDHTARSVDQLSVFELGVDKWRLQRSYRAPSAVWDGREMHLSGGVEVSELQNGRVSTSFPAEARFAEPIDPIRSGSEKPTHLATSQLRSRSASANTEAGERSIEILLQKRYATLFLPLIVALFTAPLALSLSRKGKAATVVWAIGVWLIFAGVSALSEQLGSNGLLSPFLSVWAPILTFGCFGTYLLSRART